MQSWNASFLSSPLMPLRIPRIHSPHCIRSHPRSHASPQHRCRNYVEGPLCAPPRHATTSVAPVPSPAVHLCQPCFPYRRRVHQHASNAPQQHGQPFAALYPANGLTWLTLVSLPTYFAKFYAFCHVIRCTVHFLLFPRVLPTNVSDHPAPTHVAQQPPCSWPSRLASLCVWAVLAVRTGAAALQAD